MGFDLLELGVENPGDWDPARVAEILAANDLGASVCAVMGEGRDLLEGDLIVSTQEYIRTCIDAAVTVWSSVVAGPGVHPDREDVADGRRGTGRSSVERLVEGLRPLADYAGERGVRLAIEPLNRFETSSSTPATRRSKSSKRSTPRRSGCSSTPST